MFIGTQSIDASQLGPVAQLRLARHSPISLILGALIGGAAPVTNFVTVHCGNLAWFDGQAVRFARWDNPLWLMVAGSFLLSSKSVLLWARSTLGDWWCAVGLALMLESALVMAPHPALGWGALIFLIAINALAYGGRNALRDLRDRATVEAARAPAHSLEPRVEPELRAPCAGP